MDMHAITLRLRESYEEYRKAETEAGRNAGREWAGDDASYAELKCLENEAAVLTDWNVESTPFQDYGRAHEFWEGALGSGTIPSDEFMVGFVEGALEIWKKVSF